MVIIIEQVIKIIVRKARVTVKKMIAIEWERSAIMFKMY